MLSPELQSRRLLTVTSREAGLPAGRGDVRSVIQIKSYSQACLSKSIYMVKVGKIYVGETEQDKTIPEHDHWLKRRVEPSKSDRTGTKRTSKTGKSQGKDGVFNCSLHLADELNLL